MTADDTLPPKPGCGDAGALHRFRHDDGVLRRGRRSRRLGAWRSVLPSARLSASADHFTDTCAERCAGADPSKMMMRVLALAGLLGAVEAGLTSGGKCGANAAGDSDLCKIPAVKATVDAEVDARGSGTCNGAACPCWNCHTGPGLETMFADNTPEQTTLASELTVMGPAAAEHCAAPCFGQAMDGPIKVPAGVEFTEAFAQTASWCGQWSDRQKTGGITCAETIFDAKGLLFLTIIGGALAIIFFQCSIAAIVAVVNGKKEPGADAKP